MAAGAVMMIAVVLPPCAQLLWCELYVMKDLSKKNGGGAARATTSAVIV